MKKIALYGLSFTLVAVLVFGVLPAIAGKPQDVIEKSNGYPSGPHFNLNIHGKDPLTFSCEEVLPGGNSIFVDEYGVSTIQYVTNKKSTVTDLTALEPCAGCFNNPPDNMPAKVMLPYEEEGFYVFARVRAKPNNGANIGDPSSVILSPNRVVEACNDTNLANPDFPNYTECPDDPLLLLGLIVGNNVYGATDIGFERFDNPGPGKGKAKAKDITSLFMWTGYVYNSILDVNGPGGVPDGVIDEYDVPIEYDLVANGGNGDGDIDPEEFITWQQDQIADELAWYYENKWILNIADLVVSEQDIHNDGVKLLKIRFYPVATTEFTPQ